jgi:hypothetical protein
VAGPPLNRERRAEALLGRVLAFDGTTVAVAKDGEVLHRFPVRLVTRVRQLREPKGVMVHIWWRGDRGLALKRGTVSLAFTFEQWERAKPIVVDVDLASQGPG